MYLFVIVIVGSGEVSLVINSEGYLWKHSSKFMIIGRLVISFYVTAFEFFVMKMHSIKFYGIW